MRDHSTGESSPQPSRAPCGSLALTEGIKILPRLIAIAEGNPGFINGIGFKILRGPQRALNFHQRVSGRIGSASRTDDDSFALADVGFDLTFVELGFRRRLGTVPLTLASTEAIPGELAEAIPESAPLSPLTVAFIAGKS